MSPSSALAVGTSLFSGKPKPLNRFVIVLRDTQPPCVHETEFALGVGHSLFSGKPKPLYRFVKVLRDS